MFCSKCGSEITEGAKFCEKCGASVGENETLSAEMLKNTANTYAKKTNNFLKNSGIIAINDAEESQYDVSNNTQELKNIFVEPDEQLLAKLGNGYLVNLLFNRVRKCNALLTDKRVYLKGTFYSSDSKKIFKTAEERILDLEDITGTGFIYTRSSVFMFFLSFILAVFSTILGIEFHGRIYIVGTDLGDWFYSIAGVAVLSTIFTLIRMLKSRKIFFFIDYAGGRIKIDAKLIGLSDVQDFHKQMRRAKDTITGKK